MTTPLLTLSDLAATLQCSVKTARRRLVDAMARREELVVAASLLVAEIERIDRARERLLAAKDRQP